MGVRKREWIMKERDGAGPTDRESQRVPGVPHDIVIATCVAARVVGKLTREQSHVPCLAYEQRYLEIVFALPVRQYAAYVASHSSSVVDEVPRVNGNLHQSFPTLPTVERQSAQESYRN
jgi:hypothetical protein